MDGDTEWPKEEELGDDEFLAIDLDNIIQQHKNVKRVSTTEPLEITARLSGQSPKKRKTVKTDDDETSVAVQSSSATVSKNLDRVNGIPLHRLRFGRIWVSHVVAQAWCEQQMVYDLDPPLEVLQGEVIIIEPPEVKVGEKLHLTRQLEVETVVEVRVTSKEDSFGVKVINLTNAVLSFLVQGAVIRREIPIFGTPFGLGVFVIGTIDEIRCKDTLDLEVVEFKTRRSKSFPGKAQIRSHRLQVLLYKRMFDELVMGVISKETIAKHMKLNLRKVLGPSVLELAADKSTLTLGHMLDKLFDVMKGVPFISRVSVEYAFQPDSSTIGVVQVKYAEDWLKKRLNHFFQYWKGERKAVGVDIEDAWKCHRCGYYDLCQWRTDMVKKIKENHHISQTGAESQLNEVESSDDIIIMNCENSDDTKSELIPFQVLNEPS